MGIFRQFPYSNFHEMNMDEILKIVKTMKEEWNETKTEWNSYKEFIDNYFENLDVSSEVLEALRIMANSGELNTIIDPVIINETTEWLNEYITPTTPIVDKTLSISGAAADALVTGEKIELLTNIAELEDRTLNESDMIQGSYNIDGSVLESSTRIRTSGFINVAKGDKITIFHGERCNRSMIGIFNTTGVFVREIGWNTAVAGETFTSDQKIIVVFRDENNPNQVLTPENYDALVLINSGIQEKINYYDSINIEMDNGSISSTGNTVSTNQFYTNKHSKYPIDLNGASYLIFQTGLELVSPYDYITVYFYAENLSYVGYREIRYHLQRAIIIPENSKYARIMISRLNKEHCRIYSDAELKEVKNLKLNSEYEKFLFKVSEDDFSAGSLMLAYNYVPIGEKTPLIIYMHGSGYYQTLASGFPVNVQNSIKYLTDEGYNVLDIHAWGNAMIQRYPQCGASYPYVTPTCIDILIKGVKYALEHFNIDPDRIHVMCKSQGGQLALYMASNPIIPIKSIGMFAPVLDYLSMPGEALYADTRKALALDNGFINTTYYTSESFNAFTEDARSFWNENKNALAGLNEAFFQLINETIDNKINSSLVNGKAFWDGELWTDLDGGNIYTDTDYVKLAKIPVKIWGASDDNQTPYRKMVEVVEQLLNGGNEAVLRTMPRGTGGHGSADLGSNTTTVTSASGTTYTDIPVGWVENIEWIKLHERK